MTARILRFKRFASDPGFDASAMIKRLILAACLTLAPTATWAHPHEFVTMKITAQFDANGAVTGMRYNWVFDEFFSAYALEGQDANKDGKPQQAEMDALMAEILGNIGGIDYFTAFDGNGVVPKIAGAKPVAATMQGRQFDMTFDVAFAAPVTPTKAKPLRYAIYDNEFYISMTHAPGEEGMQLANPPAGCTAQLTEPDPDEDLAAFAASLGKDETGGPDLGAAFAEWVGISCP